MYLLSIISIMWIPTVLFLLYITNDSGKFKKVHFSSDDESEFIMTGHDENFEYREYMKDSEPLEDYQFR